MTGVEADAPISHTNGIGSNADGNYYSSRGFERPVGRGRAGWLSRLTYFWVNPLLQKGVQCNIKEDTAEAFVDPPNRGYLQAEQFASAYESMLVCSFHCPAAVAYQCNALACSRLERCLQALAAFVRLRQSKSVSRCFHVGLHCSCHAMAEGSAKE